MDFSRSSHQLRNQILTEDRECRKTNESTYLDVVKVSRYTKNNYVQGDACLLSVCFPLQAQCTQRLSNCLFPHILCTPGQKQSPYISIPHFFCTAFLIVLSVRLLCTAFLQGFTAQNKHQAPLCYQPCDERRSKQRCILPGGRSRRAPHPRNGANTSPSF